MIRMTKMQKIDLIVKSTSIIHPDAMGLSYVFEGKTRRVS
jgi:hypothetical protein